MEPHVPVSYRRGLGWCPGQPTELQGPQAEPFLTHQMLWRLPNPQQQSSDPLKPEQSLEKTTQAFLGDDWGKYVSDPHISVRQAHSTRRHPDQ